MDIHEVVDDLALDVVLDFVHKKSLAHIYHLDEGKIPGTKQGKKKSPGYENLRVTEGQLQSDVRPLEALPSLL